MSIQCTPLHNYKKYGHIASNFRRKRQFLSEEKNSHFSRGIPRSVYQLSRQSTVAAVNHFFVYNGPRGAHAQSI
jgi:hypothetical protein